MINFIAHIDSFVCIVSAIIVPTLDPDLNSLTRYYRPPCVSSHAPPKTRLSCAPQRFARLPHAHFLDTSHLASVLQVLISVRFFIDIVMLHERPLLERAIAVRTSRESQMYSSHQDNRQNPMCLQIYVWLPVHVCQAVRMSFGRVHCQRSPKEGAWKPQHGLRTVEVHE